MSVASIAAADHKQADGLPKPSAVAAPALRALYPHIEPYATGKLQVSGTHTLYWERVGNPKGKPAVVLHGGPGSGCSPVQRQFFDPAVWDVLLFDQRGCGRSTPVGSLEDNTTWHSVRDIELLRTDVVRCERWVVFGGSWGSTLALAYATAFPERVKALVVRGIFLSRESEQQWFYQTAGGSGVGWVFPDHYDRFVAPIPLVERDDLLTAYHRRLVDTALPTATRVALAHAWAAWETRLSYFHYTDAQLLAAKDSDDHALVFAMIEAHYFVHGAWLSADARDAVLKPAAAPKEAVDAKSTDAKTATTATVAAPSPAPTKSASITAAVYDDDGSYLLSEASRVLEARGIPGTIVNGRYDMCCPLRTAWQLHRRWPCADLVIVPDGGHSCSGPGTYIDALIAGLEKYKDL